MKKLKVEEINLETLLCIFIVACPILDMASFLFRNAFGTNFSPSTIIRPVISIVCILYIFIKEKYKGKMIGVAAVYGIYAIAHLAIFRTLQNGASYSGVLHEAQYLVNYSFMILNLFLYFYVFRNTNGERLKTSILISSFIYISCIFLAIFTGTSSPTYIEEGIGQKGWFESGNSLGAILILVLFILLEMLKEKKYRVLTIITIALIGIFLTTQIGTRVGLFGFVLVVGLFLVVEIIMSLYQKSGINKKIITGGILGMTVVIAAIGVLGSNTLQRRKHLENMESTIMDETTGKPAHVTGDLMEMAKQIEKQTIPEGYLSEAQKKSIWELYEIANKYEIENTDQRMQELVYHLCLVKNQKNLLLMLVGNGYMVHFRELILEMEIPAFLFNFGILGFILYFIPFLFVLLYGFYMGIKNRIQIDANYLMLLLGSGFTFALSFFSGYTFFNSSTMMVIIVIDTLLMIKCQEWRKEEAK